MKIKTLQDLSDNFEVLSHSEEKETLGGVDMISTANGYWYDINLANIGYASTSFSDTDPINLGGSFSYVVDYGSGPVTINVDESDWGANAYGPNRFSLMYVSTDFDQTPFGTKIYYDNVTGQSFSASFFRSMETGAGGYDYESLPDITVSDSDMGEFSGYTIFQCQLLKYLNYDELTGGYHDYSQIISTATHYDADYIGMINAGYSQQQVDATNSAGVTNGGDMSSLMNNLNGSKLYAAQQAFVADPNNYGQQFDYGAYAASNQPITVLNLSGSAGGSFALKEFYLYLKDQLGILGYDYLMKVLHRTP